MRRSRPIGGCEPTRTEGAQVSQQEGNDVRKSVVEQSQRPGMRTGTVAELTVVAPLRTDGANRLRSMFQNENGHFGSAANLVGTLHDMRWVILDNDTRLLFCTTYDGDWDVYIDDFASKIPEVMDEVFSVLEGWPGIRSPSIKDWIVRHQVTATGWYSAYPTTSVRQIRKGQKVLQAFEVLLDSAAS